MSLRPSAAPRPSGIPAVTGLSPMEASSLAHAEAQFIGKRVAMLGLADGRNLLLEVSMASRAATDNWIAALHAAGYTVKAIVAEISIAESIRRCDAAHRHGEEELRRGRGYGGRYIPADAIQALADTANGQEIGAPGPAWYPGGGETFRLVDSYRFGSLTLDDLASVFGERHWAAVPRNWEDELGAARVAADDLEPVIAGTFDDVVHAYDQGALTAADYTVLVCCTPGPPLVVCTLCSCYPWGCSVCRRLVQVAGVPLTALR